MVTSPKDLESLQSEIASLAKRQDNLENVVLEIMERHEAATERAAEMASAVEGLEKTGVELTKRRDAATTEIDADAEKARRERDAVARTIPEALLALYDKLRAQHGGVGAAKLYQKRCEGCRLELNITEVNEVRAAASDAVVRCENCRRILVRTPESGL